MAEPLCSECGCPRDPLNANQWNTAAGRHRAEALCIRALGRVLIATRAQLDHLVRGLSRIDGATAPVPPVIVAPGPSWARGAEQPAPERDGG